MPGLHRILEALQKHDLTGLFFITGHMAEKLSNFPDTVDLLNTHQIGYHTSSHSVHPALFEFTDVKDYEEAFQASLMRETAHINPLTGALEGKGGIYALKTLFPKKQITAFRAPGHCWSPPHLEALATLGINNDFSTNLYPYPIRYKGITFQPYTISGQWVGTPYQYLLLVSSLRRHASVLTIHPSLMVNRLEWDLIYFKDNPTVLSQPPARTPAEISSLYRRFDGLLMHLRNLQKLQSIEITPPLKKVEKNLRPTRLDAEKCYRRSMKWAARHDYHPTYLFQHFIKFFEVADELCY